MVQVDSEINISPGTHNAVVKAAGMEMDVNSVSIRGVSVPLEFAAFCLDPSTREQGLRMSQYLRFVEGDRLRSLLSDVAKDPDGTERALKEVALNVPRGDVGLFKTSGQWVRHAVMFDGKDAIRVYTDSLMLDSLPEYVFSADPELSVYNIPFNILSEHTNELFAPLRKMAAIWLNEGVAEKIVVLLISGNQEDRKTVSDFFRFCDADLSDFNRDTINSLAARFLTDRPKAEKLAQRYKSSMLGLRKYREGLDKFIEEMRQVKECNGMYLVALGNYGPVFLVHSDGSIYGTEYTVQQIFKGHREGNPEQLFIPLNQLHNTYHLNDYLKSVKKAILRVRPELALLMDVED